MDVRSPNVGLPKAVISGLIEGLEELVRKEGSDSPSDSNPNPFRPFSSYLGGRASRGSKKHSGLQYSIGSTSTSIHLDLRMSIGNLDGERAVGGMRHQEGAV